MLDLNQIESFYPENLRPFKKNLLREYVQYKILETIYTSPQGRKLVFMGGTAIHVVHGNPRFSEDLDFDNRGLEKIDFSVLNDSVMTALSRNGFEVESRTVFRKAFRSYLKFENILYDSKISRHKSEKLQIQIDSEPQDSEYEPDMFILNKFDVFQRIPVIPIDILLAQKIACVFLLPRKMGRDFFDIIFLLGKTKPNMEYLKAKLGIRDVVDLKTQLMKACDSVSLETLAKDVEPFLYDPEGAHKVRQFTELVETLDL